MCVWRGLLIVVSGLLLVGCGSESDKKTTISGEAFASRYHITIRGSHPESYIEQQLVTNLLDEIDEQSSHWRDDSWISEFNRSATLEPVKVPVHVWEMLVVAEQVYRDSGGAFDVTAGPLVELWGFGADPRTDTFPPSEMQIAVALTNSGMDKLMLHHEEKSVMKRTPAVTIDLSAIAKGYTIDRIAALLEERGVEEYLVEFGGEVRAKDLSMSGDGWVVEIDDGTGLQTRQSVTLYNLAVATSGGGTRSRALSDGQTVSHLIDPRTGRPAELISRSITVKASECALADAWATTLAIDRGPEIAEAAERAGVKWINEH